MWVLVATVGSVVWVSVLGFFLALCRAAALADQRTEARVRQHASRLSHRRRFGAADRAGAQILDLRAWRTARNARVLRTR